MTKAQILVLVNRLSVMLDAAFSRPSETFTAWLEGQTCREDEVGQLARQIGSDQSWPVSLDLGLYSRDAFFEAWTQYNQGVQSDGPAL